jgi:hypothetical protein
MAKTWRNTGRRGKLQKPPPGEPFIWLTRELLASDAWQPLSINARRFMDFLLIEHMNHAGTENGRLKATYAQLEAFGLSSRLIASAIEEAEKVGLIECHRGGMRVATTYTLTWFATDIYTPPSNKWARFQKQKSARRSEGSKPPEVRADASNLPPQVKADATPRSEGPSIFRLGDAFSSEAANPSKTPSSSPAQQNGAIGAPRNDAA